MVKQFNVKLDIFQILNKNHSIQQTSFFIILKFIIYAIETFFKGKYHAYNLAKNAHYFIFS